ncbi:MAG: C4-dicarboxylate TRAP transporter large permease protein DctM [Alphaproteobacteria bacterium MarineAlpha9_Bin5]|nr:MAG: C4-dicarboxylate TRAP transporter large permease protein DctM [Alphaproteobacteria bacterium MarineAlpha9_Bin6]PPR40011.1 MAG: C4-dicarboxylate TRAP transporter large permease protein DctM [Alphaproteobacteria bacterium MarineAlpha9_Bin5]
MVELYQSSKGPVSDDHDVATSRFRSLTGFFRIIFVGLTAIGILLAVHQILGLQILSRIVLLENSYLYLLLAFYLANVFLVFPFSLISPRDYVPAYDVILFLTCLSVGGYFSITGLRSLEEGWEFQSPIVPVVLAFLLWALIMEAARRTGGPVIAIIFGLFSLYPIVADASFMPALFSGFPQDIASTARYHILSEESVLGIPMRVFGTLIIGFILFGVTLQTTGGGRFFINLAFALLGGVRGGPAKVAIFASGLFGSLSGSVVTNVLTTGAMTIPAMKRIGYPARYAGGIEACASTGGVLMPPVMGATAFVMASFLDVPYLAVAAAAVVPSFLYFFALFVQIDSYAARNNVKGLPREELPSTRKTISEGWYYVFGFLLLIYLLIYLKREAHAPFYATIVLLALSQFGKLSLRDPWYYILGLGIITYLGIVLSSVQMSATYTTTIPFGAGILLLVLCHVPTHIRVSFNRVREFVESSGRLLTELVAILAAVGLIIGGLMMTGMASSFSGEITRLAGEKLIPLLLMGAATAFILGVGMTVTAAYILLAIVLAPALIGLGLDPIAVHLFILYWGMISFITPPVALGAFAAASLAGATPMRTGFEAMRLGSVIYFLPFFFVLNPALVLHGDAITILLEVGSAIVGIVLIASGLQGHLVLLGSFSTDIRSMAARIVLIAGGLALAYPEMASNIAGLAALPAAAILRRQSSD